MKGQVAMAERRMFSKQIIDSDAFLDMPSSTQSLYFHLNMRADDDGFVNNPKKIQRMIGGSDDDLKLLLAKRFILAFESGIIVIKHWRLNNYIRKDRYTQTLYQEELARLDIKENGSYTERLPSGIPTVNQTVDQRLPQVRLGKDRLEEDIGAKSTRFKPPTLEEVKNYCQKRKNNVDPAKWHDFYQSKGWMVGKNKMKDWQAAVRTWERDSNNAKSEPITKNPAQEQKEMDDIQKLLDRMKGDPG